MILSISAACCSRQATVLFNSFARWWCQRNCVSKGCNFVTLGQIKEKRKNRKDNSVQCVKVSIRSRLFQEWRIEHKLRC